MDMIENELELVVHNDCRPAPGIGEHGDHRSLPLVRSMTTEVPGTLRPPTHTITPDESEPGLEHQRTASDLMSRRETQRLQYTQTVGGTKNSRSRASREPWPAFGGGKPYPPPLPAREEYVVEFGGLDDSLHPQNWTLYRKYVILSSQHHESYSKCLDWEPG
jgi:hypothetical protein